MIWETKFPIIKNIIKKLRLSIDIKRRSILRGSTLIENLSDCRNVLHFNTRNVCKPVSGYESQFSPNQLPDALHRHSPRSCFQPMTASLCWSPRLLLFPFLVFPMYGISYAKMQDLSIRKSAQFHYRIVIPLYSTLSFSPMISSMIPQASSPVQCPV